MAIGYFSDVTEADSYFADERLETLAWDNLISSSALPLKSKCLFHAFNRIFYSQNWTLPTPALATAAELIILKKAQAEMAYYIALHVYGEDEDRRKGLQAQAVTDAGIIEEKYDKDRVDTTPIPAPVIDLLEPWSADAHRLFFANVERDEDESVLTKVHEF